MDVGYLYFNTY